MRSRVVYLLLFVFILIALLSSPLTSYLFKDFIISRLEKSLDMNIVIGKTQLKFPLRLAISNIKAVDKYGPAFVAKSAELKFDASKVIRAKIVLKCNFQNVEVKGKASNTLNDILKPLAVPPQDIYSFDDINGIITIMKGVFAFDDLKARGPDFKLSGNYLRTNNKEVNYDIEFNINKRVVNVTENQKIPFLIDEDGDGWYTIVFSMKGSPNKPSNIFFSTGGIKLQAKPLEQ